MAKFVHKTFQDVYYVSRGMYGYTVRKNTTGSKLDMDNAQYKEFENRMKKNGWYELINRYDYKENRVRDAVDYQQLTGSL